MLCIVCSSYIYAFLDFRLSLFAQITQFLNSEFNNLMCSLLTLQQVNIVLSCLKYSECEIGVKQIQYCSEDMKSLID